MSRQLQLPLYSEPVHTITPTQSRTNSRSAKADARAKVVNASAARQIILSAIEQSGANGMTRDELAVQLGLKIQTVCPRVHELLSVDNPRVAVLGKEFRRNGKSVLVYRG